MLEVILIIIIGFMISILSTILFFVIEIPDVCTTIRDYLVYVLATVLVVLASPILGTYWFLEKILSIIVEPKE